MNTRKQNAAHIKIHATKKLRVNLAILTVVYIVLFIFTIYNLFVSQALFSQVLIAIVLGLTVGIISSRMYKITWDKNEEKVVGRIDIYGVIVLVLFVIFELNRNAIATLFAGSEAIGSISLVLVTTTLLGRIIGTSRKILHVLTNEKVI